MLFRILSGTMFLLDQKTDEGDGGGGDSKSKTDAGKLSEKDIADLKTQNATLLARLEKLEAGSKKTTDDSTEDDLNAKVKKAKEITDQKSADTRTLESALKFSLTAPDFLKNNQSLLPKDITEIFKAAEKETYESAIEKANAIKSSIIQSFFSTQANLDLLTPGLKTTLEDYLKLTKNGKQDKAQHIYDTIFEPSLEMLRRVKKAEALNKGHGNATEGDDAYKTKMINLSRKHYLGEKSNA